MSKSESALDLLAGVHSWQLNRISTTTFPQDVVATIRRSGQPMDEKEVEAVTNWVRTGTCYRCRIGKGRFFFGDSPEEAARRAVKAQPKKP